MFDYALCSSINLFGAMTNTNNNNKENLTIAIERLRSLCDKGILTQDEFEAEKAILINSYEVTNLAENKPHQDNDSPATNVSTSTTFNDIQNDVHTLIENDKPKTSLFPTIMIILIAASSLIFLLSKNIINTVDTNSNDHVSTHDNSYRFIPTDFDEKPKLIGFFGSWGVYRVDNNAGATCYVLGQNNERYPKAKLKNTTGKLFITTRPSQGIHNEVAINLDYHLKNDSAAHAEIDGKEWELLTKGENAWLNRFDESSFVEALRSGFKLTIKATSAKNTQTSDLYPLAGVSEAINRAETACK